MTDETPTAVPATVLTAIPAEPSPTPIPGFKFGAGHLASLMGVGYAGNELTKPLIHWLVTGGAPDVDAQSALATIASLLIGGVAIYLTRGRAGIAAAINGDSNNATS